MKAKKMRRILAMSMALALLLSACGQNTAVNDAEKDEETADNETSGEDAEASESEYPEYLNLDSAYPIIKDEHEGTIKLTAMIGTDTKMAWTDLWIDKYLKDRYNIELDVEFVQTLAIPEKKSLALNSGDLPDIMIDMQFSTNDLVKYGASEELLLQMDEYMNETLTPNILKYWSDDVRKACTASDGHVYSLPLLSESYEVDPGVLVGNRMFVNTTWMEALDLEMPRTLDEFIDVVYAMKEGDPAGVGSENVYPISGGMYGMFSTWYVLNAFGYNTYRNTNTTGNFLIDPTMRDGEVVIPVYDMEVFQEYLKLMNQFYTDGIIAPNFFTLDGAEIDAHCASGQSAFYMKWPNQTGIDVSTWGDWESCYPLTSEWQEEAEAHLPPTVGTVGGVVVAADTEYPELCMRFLDIFFDTDTCAVMNYGPAEGSEYNYDGYVNSIWDEEAQTIKVDPEQIPEQYKDNDGEYRRDFIIGQGYNFGAQNLRASQIKYVESMGKNMPEEKVYDVEKNPSDIWYLTLKERVAPYVTENYPSYYYVDEETSLRITDLITVLKPYVDEQVAAFIVGNRPLSETADFAEELKNMGMEDLLNIYKDIYTAYNAN